MKLAELKELIASLPSEWNGFEVVFKEIKKPELRDIVNAKGELEKTIVSFGSYCGYRHVTEWEKEKADILLSLAGKKDSRVWSSFRRFTPIHGDFRIYDDRGGVNDTCYGNVIDPRAFYELEKDGFILFYQNRCNSVPNIGLTEKGMKKAEEISA